MGRGTRPPRRGAIGADDFDTGRRGVRFGSGTGPSETVLRLFHVQPPDAGSAAPRDTSFRGTRDERSVFVPCHASLLSAGRNPRAHIRDGRKTEERCDLRAYRRTDGGRAEEAGVAIEVRHGHVESDRPASRGAGASESEFRDTAFRSRLFSRGVNAGGSCAQCVHGYQRQQLVDQVSTSGRDSKGCVPQGFGSVWAKPIAVWNGLKFLSQGL